MEALRIKDLYKTYGEVQVLKKINISVDKGEFLSLLGPSGCGKTTLLRIIAGLTEATGGEILVEGRDVSKLPPFKRNNGMVFQNYALFPHMTVFENIAFGLKMRNMSTAEIKEKIQEGLALVHLEGLAERYPKELSGGQQQRVALIRALILNPTLLLLDEPLCNLDAKLRQEMRVEIRKLQQKLGVTTIFVTHDQEEALTMSDRIAVINSGHLEQVGTPNELYEKPKTKFVANFIGATNLIEAEYLADEGNNLELKKDDYIFKIKIQGLKPAKRNILFSIRPECITIAREEIADMNNLCGVVITRDYLGSMVSYEVQDKFKNIYIAVAQTSSEASRFVEGDPVVIAFHPDDCLFIEQ